MGPGLGFNYYTSGANFDFGFRVPIGVQLFATDKIEIFLEVAPHLFVMFINNSVAQSSLDFRVGSSLGVRYWI